MSSTKRTEFCVSKPSDCWRLRLMFLFDWNHLYPHAPWCTYTAEDGEVEEQTGAACDK